MQEPLRARRIENSLRARNRKSEIEIDSVLVPTLQETTQDSLRARKTMQGSLRARNRTSEIEIDVRCWFRLFKKQCRIRFVHEKRCKIRFVHEIANQTSKFIFCFGADSSRNNAGFAWCSKKQCGIRFVHEIENQTSKCIFGFSTDIEHRNRKSKLEFEIRKAIGDFRKEFRKASHGCSSSFC